MKLINADDIPFIEYINGSVNVEKEVVDNMPAIETRTVKYAHWIDKKGQEICSACGKDKFEGLDADIWAYWSIPFCPHCGAKMTNDRGLHNNK